MCVYICIFTFSNQFHAWSLLSIYAMNSGQIFDFHTKKWECPMLMLKAYWRTTTKDSRSFRISEMKTNYCYFIVVGYIMCFCPERICFDVGEFRFISNEWRPRRRWRSKIPNKIENEWCAIKVTQWNTTKITIIKLSTQQCWASTVYPSPSPQANAVKITFI